jgi:hypothetical protein
MGKSAVRDRFLYLVLTISFLTGCMVDRGTESSSPTDGTESSSPTDGTEIVLTSTAILDLTPTPFVSATNTPRESPAKLRYSPMDTEPCMAPCWGYIIPGETSLDEVLRILADEKGLSGCAPNNGWITCDYLIVHFDENDKVEDLQMWPSETVTLGQVSSVYGEPDEVHFCVSYTNSHDSSSVLYFAKYKLWLFVNELAPPREMIRPDMVVRRFMYGPTVFDEIAWNCELYKSTAWHGYGDYQKFDQ